MSRVAESPEKRELNRVANLLIAEWNRVEMKPVSPSFVATFVDMARVVIADKEEHAPHGVTLGSTFSRGEREAWDADMDEMELRNTDKGVLSDKERAGVY